MSTHFLRGKYVGVDKLHVAAQYPGYILWNIEYGYMKDELTPDVVDMAHKRVAELREALVEANAQKHAATLQGVSREDLKPLRQAVDRARSAIENAGGTGQIQMSMLAGAHDEGKMRALACLPRARKTTPLQVVPGPSLIFQKVGLGFPSLERPEHFSCRSMPVYLEGEWVPEPAPAEESLSFLDGADGSPGFLDALFAEE